MRPLPSAIASKLFTALVTAGDGATRLAPGGISLATSGMRALPVGVPKVMVSTMASGDTRPYVGPSDICMMYSVTDVQGIHRISEQVLANAAHALAGMGREAEASAREKMRDFRGDDTRLAAACPRQHQQPDHPRVAPAPVGHLVEGDQQRDEAGDPGTYLQAAEQQVAHDERRGERAVL